MLINSTRKRRFALHKSEHWWTLFFLAPYLIGFVLFVGGPILAAFALSFTEWDIVSPPAFAGVDNYLSLFTDDRLFWTSLWNTLKYTALIVPLEIVLAFLLAVLINQKLRGITLFRAIYFMPFVLSLAAIGLLWTWIYSPTYGMIDFVLKALHIPSPKWLNDPAWAMLAVVFTTLWRNSGYYMVIFLAGLQAVPQELHEAAGLDGANYLQRMRHVTVPLLSPTTFFVVVIAIIWAFQVFDLIYVMTKGGPGDSTVVLVYYLYDMGFRWFQMGRAASLAFILFAITMLITISQFQLQKRWVHYQ